VLVTDTPIAGAVTAVPAAAPAVAIAAGTIASPPLTFGMLLQNTDVGVGQTGKGTQRRSPEVFIPMKAVDLKPAFWKWTAQYVADPQWAYEHSEWQAEKTASGNPPKRGVDKLDWSNVQIDLIGHAGILTATIWFNPIKVDIRIRNAELRAAGNVNDILLVQEAPPGAPYHFRMEVVPPTDPRYAGIRARLLIKIPNSEKVFGYF